MKREADLRTTKLFYFLQHLPPFRITEFHRWLKNRKKLRGKSLELFEFIWKESLKKPSKQLNKRDLKREIGLSNPDKSTTSLVKYLSEFLAEKEAIPDTLELDRFLIRSWFRYNMTHFFPGKSNQWPTGKIPESISGLTFRREMESHRYFFSVAQQNRPEVLEPGPMLNAIDHEIAVLKLKSACHSLNQDQILGKHNKVRLIREVIEMVAAEAESFPLLVRLYYFLYLSMEDPESLEKFTAFSNLYTERRREIAGSDRRELAVFFEIIAFGRLIAREMKRFGCN